MRHAKDRATPLAEWLRDLLARKPCRLVSVARANKLARIAWALLTRGETYRVHGPAA
jgi:transposase